MDFGQVGAANLWKSGPLFSTDTKEAELMLEELRLSPRAPGARSWGRCRGAVAASSDVEVKRRLSTGYAERARLRSTGRPGPIHRMCRGFTKEEVG